MNLADVLAAVGLGGDRQSKRQRDPHYAESKYAHVSGSRAANRTGPGPATRQVWRTPDGVMTRCRRPGAVRDRVPR
jgi:hypothetical protein